MSRLKRIWIATILVCAVLITSGYLFLRYRVLAAKDYSPDPGKGTTVLDLRPALIAKLRQLVKDGSDGLYQLTLDSLNPDLAASALDARNVRLQVDSAGYRQLASRRQLPDEVFDIRLASLQIKGINLDDLLQTRQVDISGIFIVNPLITVYRQKQPYNAGKRAVRRQLTLYQRLRKGMDRIRIGKVDIRQGTFISVHAGGRDKAATFRNISIVLDRVLIDSSTQYDNSRFLFAENAALETKDYSLPSPDSLYEFKIGTLSIAGHRHEAIARNVVLQPWGGRDAFLRRLKTRDELFTVTCPKLSLAGIEWWAMVNGAGLTAEKADIDDAVVDVYLDKSLPLGTPPARYQFPHQRLMKIPFPVSVKQVQFHNASVSYSELNPGSGQTGTVRFTGISAVADDISNVPAVIKSHPVATFRAKATFMQQTAMECTFRLDLSKYKTGAFSVDVRMGNLDNNSVNRFAPAMSLLFFSSGQLQEGSVQLTGDNHGVKGTVTMRYTDLHITPLKEKGKSHLKEKKLTELLANLVLIKNKNPGKDGMLRRPDISYRPQSPCNFFNLIWTGIKTGLLKTIGIPLSLGLNQ